MSAQGFDVVVIGGGLHGLSAALYLARGGKRVVIVEESWVGRHASGASAAGVRTLNRALEELPISLEAMDMWHNMTALVGSDCGFHAHGQIQVAETADSAAVLERRLERSRAAGFTHEEMIDRDELRRLVPAIAPHCVAGLTVRTDGAADPHKTLDAFRRSAEEAGAVIEEGCGVTAIARKGADWQVHADGRDFVAPHIVNAAGAWAAKIAAMVGDEIALGHKASLMMVTERIAPLLKPVVSLVGRPLSFKQTDQGTLVIGGGLQGRADIEAQKSFVDFLQLSRSARAVTDLFPMTGPLRIVRSWAGMEAKTEDSLPVIGPSPHAEGVVHAFGFSGHGFQLVPVVGSIVSDLIIHGGTNRKIASFAAERLMPRRDAA
ncbi:NAD(P)/FAD-dependent oxidoreductase [Nitratireductor rhodophyticola]|uniref:NAD(P)/FAD-dependent oxidoreductase n=1 Tax=Nitratireductor rhodophyticola TaxID=2854036 RepID=UPI003BA861D7